MFWVCMWLYVALCNAERETDYIVIENENWKWKWKRQWNLVLTEAIWVCMIFYKFPIAGYLFYMRNLKDEMVSVSYIVPFQHSPSGPNKCWLFCNKHNYELYPHCVWLVLNSREPENSFWLSEEIYWEEWKYSDIIRRV